MPLKYSRFEDAAFVTPKPTFLERRGVVYFAYAEADEVPTLASINPPFIGLGLRHARQVGLPPAIIDKYG